MSNQNWIIPLLQVAEEKMQDKYEGKSEEWKCIDKLTAVICYACYSIKTHKPCRIVVTMHKETGFVFMYEGIESQRMNVNCDEPTITRLAMSFSRTLKKWLSLEEMQQLVKLTKKETDKSICHSHNFCDANMAMFEAFNVELGEDVILPSEVKENPLLEEKRNLQNKLWKAAWDMAKQTLFYTN